jgi:hypothetical protein
MRNQAVTAVSDSLAVYRITKLIMEDKITEDLREWVYDKFPQGSKVRYLINCPWCVSVWGGLAIFGLRHVSPKSADLLSGALAASAVTGVIYQKGLDQPN